MVKGVEMNEPFFRPRPKPKSNIRRFTYYVLLAIGALLTVLSNVYYLPGSFYSSSVSVPLHASQILQKCASLNTKPGPSPTFHKRVVSDRFQPGTKPILIRNATIWTGNVDGLEVVKGDIFVDRGIIKAIGSVGRELLNGGGDLVTIDAKGAWISPGIIDLHSHLGVESSPTLKGADDGNSMKGLIMGWLRSVDGLNTHDEGFRHTLSGGVTTSLILPGSADAMGGQAFVIKLRPTKERSTSSLLLEPPYDLNGSTIDPGLPLRWRHMKHACGENPSRIYEGTRMDTSWAFRQAYDKARQIKESQDQYCAKAVAGRWTDLGGEGFPEELQWEALVDILRGKVKVQTHCYEAVDIDNFVRLSNEFRFPVAAFHHAHEAYLVPEVLKRAYEKPPAIAMFAAFSRYKKEAYRHSEFAPRILADNGIKVVMKSDHPGIVSRYLVHEAQQVHYYGLPAHVALSAVISTPAEVLGLDHRIGYIREGYDADIVFWDSHPLALGATPTQVIVDGIPQIEDAIISQKPPQHQRIPKTPNFDLERKATIEHEGLPPLEPSGVIQGEAIFRNVSSVWYRDSHGIREASQHPLGGIVVVNKGRIVCSGAVTSCASYVSDHAVNIDLEGGSISPALVSFGSSLGLQDISGEESTNDGIVYDALSNKKIPSIIGGDDSIIKAVDGLQFGTRDALLAYRGGVTLGITPPSAEGFSVGLSTSFSLSSKNKLEHGAVVEDVVALHVAIGHGSSTPSISTKIAALRRLLLEPGTGESGKWFKKASLGLIPLVVRVHNADIIATLLLLKREVELSTGIGLKLTLVGATEAHLLAKEIAAANVGVILLPPRSFPYTWEMRKILPGPPLTPQSAVTVLVSHNVTVGLGPQGVNAEESMSTWAVRNLRFDAAWAALDSGGIISKTDALAMASSNIESLLGIHTAEGDADLVATRGGDMLSFESKVVAVVSPRRDLVDLF